MIQTTLTAQSLSKMNERVYIHSLTGTVMTQAEIDDPNDSENDEESLLTPVKIANYNINELSVSEYQKKLMSNWNTFSTQKDMKSENLMNKLKKFMIMMFEKETYNEETHKEGLLDFIRTFSEFQVIQQCDEIELIGLINKLFISSSNKTINMQ